jgi:hypothetical protein
VLYSRVTVHGASESHRPQRVGPYPLAKLADRGSRDGEIEDERQSGYLFDVALPRII